MKYNFKINVVLVIFLLVLFSGCHQDDLRENKSDQTDKVTKVTASELLMFVQNQDIKKTILKASDIKKGNNGSNDFDLYFEKLDFVEFDNYTTFLNDYTSETPYYRSLVITIDDKNVENAFYVQYTPTKDEHDSSQSFNIKSFTGEMGIFDLNMNPKVTIPIFHGAVGEVYEIGDCKTTISVTEVPCTHGDKHGVGEDCRQGFINDAYFLVRISTICGPQFKFAAGGGSGAGGGGGGAPMPSAGSIFLNKLNSEDKAFLNANTEVRSSVLIYLETTKDDETEANAFAHELIDIGKYFLEEYGTLGNDELNAIRMTRETKLKGYFTAPFDENYYKLIDTYISADLKDQAALDVVQMYFAMQVGILKTQHPEWSMIRVYATAALELVHIGLDIAGMVPVYGEVADLANGVIYSVEGDGLNATLSFAATIPIVGWTSTGAKYAYKAINITATSKTTLKWFVKADNVITFGNRGQLRNVLKITDATKQAHHIIPWGKNMHKVVQRAAKSGNEFHMNEALNGIAVASWRNQPNHTAYDDKIVEKLDQFIRANPNATPNQCYNALTNVIANAKQAIINNPNVHLNNLSF